MALVFTTKPADAASAPAEATPTWLDEMWTAERTAAWLGLKTRTLLEMAARGEVPIVRINGRTVRFHPRTILKRLKQESEWS